MTEKNSIDLFGYWLEEDRIPTGWLSPTGEFVPCRSYEHISTARDLLHDYGISKPDVELLNRGFCSISIVSVFDHGYAIGLRQHLTPEQKKFLEPCPFCGRTDTLHLERYRLNWEWWGYIECTECIMTGPVRKLKKDVVDAWNRRNDNGNV